MHVGSKVRVKYPKSVFTGYIGEIVRLDRSRGRMVYFVDFPNHPWSGLYGSFGFDAYELEEVEVAANAAP